MKKRTKILSIIGTGLVLALLAFFANEFFKEDEPFEINAENVAVFLNEESTYYLKHAPQDISFELSTTKNIEEIDYTLVNGDGEEVEAEIKETETDSYELSPAKSSYTKGERYTLTLGSDVQFVNEYLADAESLVFAIEREHTEQYAFTDAVKEVEETIIEVDDSTIQLTDFQGEAGDLIFGVNEQEKEVMYKVVEAQGEDTFQVERPALDEIYAELELYGKYALDLNRAASNPTLDAEMVQAIQESEFYSALMIKAYAEEKSELLAVDVEVVDHSEDEILEYRIELTLEPGEDGLFGDSKFKEHE